MRSAHISVDSSGGPEVLRLAEREVPVPGPGQVRVRVTAAGVSYGDVLLRVGVIPGGPKRPYTPGFDLTGVVEATGAGVAGVAPGQAVTALVASGGYAEHAVVPAGRLVAVPAGADHTRVAAAVLNYFVAYQMLHRVARARPGQPVLVHGAAGGVGLAFLQLGALAGLDIYGTCSAARQHLVAAAGAHPIDYRAQDFVRVVRSRAGGGVTAAFDPVGGSHFRRSYATLGRGGILVAYGQSAAYQHGRTRRRTGLNGFLTGILLPKLIPDGKRALFYNAWSLDKKQPHAYQQDLTRVLQLLADGTITPPIAATHPLTHAAQIHHHLEHGAPTGKIVLTMP